MKLNLKRDLVIIDLETTGLSVSKDRIIQVAILKIFANGSPNVLKVRYVNPEIPIPAVVTALTGITNEMVRNEPIFSKIAKNLLLFIGDSDIATYNGNRFDIPMLMENLSRAKLTLDMAGRHYVDVKRIFHRMEPRTLAAAYKFYTGEPMENAHDAGADVNATYNVLEAMLDKYEGVDFIDKDDTVIPAPIVNDIESLYRFTTDSSEVDFMGLIKYNEQRVPIFNFGKYHGKSVGESLLQDANYYNWIMNTGDFTADTRNTIKKILEEYKELKQNEATINKPKKA